MFIERGHEMTVHGGMVAMITMESWMFRRRLATAIGSLAVVLLLLLRRHPRRRRPTRLELGRPAEPASRRAQPDHRKGQAKP